MPASKKPNKQRGIEFDIKSVAAIARGGNEKEAQFAKDLLKMWSKVPGYEGAKKALEEL